MSVDAIKKFLEDAQNYPDATMVTIGDQQVPLGSLRALSAGERQQVADRIKEIDQQKADLNDRIGKVTTLGKQAQEIFAQAEAARAAAAAAGGKNGSPGDDPFKDPWLAPVKTELEARDKSLAEMKEMLRTVVNTVTNAATIFSEERWDNQYGSINFGKRDKKPTRQELIEYATKNGIKDRHGLPSVTGAWEKMSEPDRLEEIRQSALEQGRQEGRQAVIAARVPMPGVAGPGQAPQMPKLNVNPSDLGDLHGEAMKDPELRALLDQAASLNIM